MKCVVGALVFTVACSGVAFAQAGAPAVAYPAPEDRGYFAFVGQAAFSNVTSQSYGIEAGVAVARHFQLYTDIGVTRDVAPASLDAAAQTIAGGLSNLQPNVGNSVKEPATFAVFGVRYAFGVSGSSAKPYVMAGIGVAHLKREATFTVAGADVTGSLGQDQYGNIVLGSDLTGSANDAMFEFGGGLALPLLSHLLIDLQLRYGRLFATPDGINVTRAGLGVGVRF
jgi:opacity protein-like surface antigen